MNLARLLAVAAVAIPLGPSIAMADSCRARSDETGAPKPCRPEERLRPVDLDRASPRSRANVYDDGRGTEIRVDGRVSSEFGVRR